MAVQVGSGAQERGRGQLSEGTCHTGRWASLPLEMVFVQRQTGGFHFSNLEKNRFEGTWLEGRR